MPFREDQVRGKNIVIIEDIFDSGSTMMRMLESLRSFEPKELKACTIFHKKNPKNLKHNYFADYVGFAIPDVFIVGYGMDFNDMFREIPHLVVLGDKGISTFKCN